MTVATATLAQLKAAFEAASALKLMLVEYNQGNPAASVSTGRSTIAEIDAQITAAAQALLPIAAADTIVALGMDGTFTCTDAGTDQLSATVTYANLDADDVTDIAAWSSDDTDVATVDAAGLVTGVAAGVCNITATFEGFSVTYEFTVTAA